MMSWIPTSPSKRADSPGFLLSFVLKSFDFSSGLIGLSVRFSIVFPFTIDCLKMKSTFIATLLILWCTLSGMTAYAQFQITNPVSRMVYQRNNANVANVPIAGLCPVNSSSVQARLVSRQGGSTTGWQPISEGVSQGYFQGYIYNVQGGWYDLEVQINGGTILRTERIGVGEVFVTAGQSNSWGSNWNKAASYDDRVNVASYRTENPSSFSEYDLPMNFQQAGPGSNMAPTSPVFMWGKLGDLLAQKLGVPVMFFGAAQPGSSSQQWADAANGAVNIGGALNLVNSGPYHALGAAILHYLRRTGCRAVLWHQGESDNNANSTQGYFNNIMAAINKSRSQMPGGNLSWVIAKVSYFPATPMFGRVGQPERDQNIINAQNMLAGQSNNWSGPNTDNMTGSYYRPHDGLHFADQSHDNDQNPGARELANAWNNELNGGFFGGIQPSIPSSKGLITTGYVHVNGQISFGFGASTNVSVPFKTTAPSRDNIYKVEILTEGGQILADLGTGSGNNINVNIPNWANGRYRLRVCSVNPYIAGESSDPFQVYGSGSGTPDGGPVGPTSTQPTTPTAPEGPTTPTGSFALTQPDYNCSTGAFTFKSTGPAGQVLYWAAGITGQTTNPGPYTVRPLSDWGPMTLNGSYNGQTVTYSFDWKGYCNGGGSTTPTTPTTPTIPTTPTGSFALTQPDYNCSTGAFTFKSTGPAGQVLYWAAGITGQTTNPGPYTVRPLSDWGPMTLNGSYNGQTVTYSFDWKGYCNGGGSTTPTTPTTPTIPTTPTGSFALSQPDYNCSTGAFTFKSTGPAGQVLYWTAGITNPTTTAGPYTVRPLSDWGPMTLNGSYNGQTVTYSFDWKGYCNGGGSTTPTTPTIPTTPTANGNYEGFLDYSNCNGVGGWIWDQNNPNSAVTIEFYKNGVSTGVTTLASNYRSDLQNAGKGNGAHGFSLALPQAFRTGSNVTLTARVQGSTFQLSNTFTVNCPQFVARIAISPEADGYDYVVYPNPTADQITVKSTNQTAEVLNVVNLKGETIQAHGKGNLPLHD